MNELNALDVAGPTKVNDCTSNRRDSSSSVVIVTCVCVCDLVQKHAIWAVLSVVTLTPIITTNQLWLLGHRRNLNSMDI